MKTHTITAFIGLSLLMFIAGFSVHYTVGFSWAFFIIGCLVFIGTLVAGFVENNND